MESWNRWKPAPNRNLLAEAEKRKGPNVANKLIYMPPWKEGRGTKKVEDLRDGRFSKNLPKGLRTATAVTIPEGLTDVLVRFRATIHFHYEAWSKMPNSFTVGLYDQEESGQASLGMLRQEYWTKLVCEYQQAHWSSGKYTVNLCGGPSFYRTSTDRLAPRLVPGVSKEEAEAGLCEYTLIRLGNETAIYVDGVPVLHLPVNSKVNKVGIYFYFGTCNFRIRDLVVHPLTGGAAPAGE